MKDVFVNAAGNREQHQRAEDHQVMRHQCMGEKNQQHQAYGRVEQVFGKADFAAAEMECRILASIINKGQKRYYQDGGSDEIGFLQSSACCQLLLRNRNSPLKNCMPPKTIAPHAMTPPFDP